MDSAAFAGVCLRRGHRARSPTSCCVDNPRVQTWGHEEWKRTVMRMRLNVLPVLFLTVNPFAIFGQDQPSPKSLKGLHGVFFQVYSDQGLQHSMEIQVNRLLTGAGIEMRSKRDWELTPDTAMLQLNALIRCERDESSCGYSVSLKLGQHVQIMRGERPVITATTWHNSYTGSIQKAHLTMLPDLIAVDAGTLIREFIDDYRKANP